MCEADRSKRDRETGWERYSRHILLEEVGEEGQERLQSSKVLIVGVGGLGGPVALYLAAAGVGTLGLVDFDRVELSNLQRQIIHTTANVGKYKVDSAGEMLRGLNPEVRIVPHVEKITEDNVASLLAGYDIVVDCVDNFETKFLINDACVKAGLPFVHGGVLQFHGQVMTYVPGAGPCYRCIFEEVPPEGSVPNCRVVGVMGAVVGIIGSLQATEVLKYLLGAGKLLTGRMLVVDGLSMKFREVVFAHPSPFCRACGGRQSGEDR